MIIENIGDLREYAKLYLKCWTYFKPAMDINKTHNELDLFSLLVKGDAFLVSLEKSAGVIEIIKYPRFNSCRIWLAGGDLNELVEFYPVIQDWSIKNNCQQIEIFGRKGWERIHEDHKTTSVLLVKEL